MSINTSKFLGTLAPQQQPYKYGRRTDGRYSNVVYASLSQAQIDSLAAQADARGLNYEFQNNFGQRSELVIEYNFNFINNSFASEQTEADTTWEIVPQKAMKSLLDVRNPLVLAASQAEVQILKGWKRQNTLETNLVDPTTGNFVIPKIQGTAFSASGIKLAKALYDGVEQVEVPAPVLTRTLIVTQEYIYPSDFQNVGRIISSGTLIANESVPTTVLFDFPTDTDPAAVNIPGTSLYQLYQYGWLKNSPSVRQVANRKWNLTQTWDYGLWLVDLTGARL